MTWRDSPMHYGRVSRALHWGMAGLLAWQFTSTLVRVLLSDTALDDFMWSTHRTTGVLLMSLVVLRVAWALYGAGSRPPAISRLALLGHGALYGLMIVVPLVALLRQYGSGRPLSTFGVTLMPGFEGERIDWMVNLGSTLHGLLGWTLLTLILGHVVMAALHRRRGEDVIPRMIGSGRQG